MYVKVVLFSYVNHCLGPPHTYVITSDGDMFLTIALPPSVRLVSPAITLLYCAPADTDNANSVQTKIIFFCHLFHIQLVLLFVIIWIMLQIYKIFQ